MVVRIGGAAADQLPQQVPELVAGFRVEAVVGSSRKRTGGRAEPGWRRVEPRGMPPLYSRTEALAGALEPELREQVGGAGAGDLGRQG